MAFVVLHIIHTVGRIFRPEHVRRCRGGEFPPVSGRAGKRGTSPATSKTGQTNGKETKKCVCFLEIKKIFLIHLFIIIFFRNARASILQKLQQRPAIGAQRRDV